MSISPIIVLSPFGSMNYSLLHRASAAGALSVIDGSEATSTLPIERFLRSAAGPVGLRFERSPKLPWELVADVIRDNTPNAVILGSECLEDPEAIKLIEDADFIMGEALSCDEAFQWIKHGVDGVLIRGREGGGRTGESSSPVILRQILARHSDAQVWVRGGVGRHTIRGLMAAGAAGVVLDVQFALMPEADTSAALRRLLSAPSLPRPVRQGGEQMLPTARGLYRTVPQSERRIGDDALIAALFERHYKSISEAIKDLIARVQDFPQTWETVNRLNITEGRAGRSQHTRLPFIQGPMTRVSDVPEFVREVCDAGALGALALAASSPETARALMSDAETMLEGRSWAVGLLGFIDEKLIRKHLELVRDSSASAVVLAGGRPYQEKMLREAGKQCFVHVPSPGLLRTFITEGARCFIFEGAECGGHIGPLHSLPLWEQQISVLLEVVDEGDLRPDELVLAMAGGIYDSYTAAMALLTAADLIKEGAAVSLLMGTAYSLTTEALRTGAVTQDFCDVVISTKITARLETAPGHVTRCVPTPLIEEIAEVRQSMSRAGEPDQNIWIALEKMTLGRLRIATKGVDREGNELRSVPIPERHTSGLYMTGEASQLINSVSDIDALHTQILEGLEQVRQKAPCTTRYTANQPHTPWGEGIAIIGVSGLFPGGKGVNGFWRNILDRVDLVTEVPTDRWNPEVFLDNGKRNIPHTDSTRGAFLPATPFDPVSYGIPPRALASIEPVQLLSLEAANNALIDAGLTPGSVDAITSIIFGAESGSDLSAGIALRTGLPMYTGSLPDELDTALPPLTTDSFPGMLANVVSGRIANRLDVSGSNFVVDAACASSLSALKAACQELLLGDCDIAVAGGADTHNGIGDYVMFSSVGALSKKGTSRPFDKDADGIVLGEAVACVVLKRVADAVRDGDRIYATIRGIGSSSDGRATGLTAPRLEGQYLALERAYAAAQVAPASVDLIEAHGTGTVVGDRTELQALTNFMTDNGMEKGSCVIGSLKSQFGHTKCAAGMLGIVKAALSINQGVLPPMAGLAHPSAVWHPDSSPFVFRDTPAPWAANLESRVAGVSAFGFGGTNYHCVLTGQHATTRPLHDPRQPVLVALRGKTVADARETATQARRTLECDGDVEDVLETLSQHYSSTSEPVQFAFAFRTTNELLQLLEAVAGDANHPALQRRSQNSSEQSCLAVLFSGQGGQKVGMAQDIILRRPDLSWLVRDQKELLDNCFPPQRFTAEEKTQDEHDLTRTDRAQRLLAMAQMAGWMAFSELGADVSMLAGHSFGEIVALAAGGSMTSRTLYGLAKFRGEAMKNTGDGGAMTAIRAGADEVSSLLSKNNCTAISIANINSASQVVVGGPVEQIEAFERIAVDAQLNSRRLAVSAAFHTKQMEPSSSELAQRVADMNITHPTTSVYRNRVGAPYDRDVDIIEELASQLRSPVNFEQMVRNMMEDGANVFVEIGPGRILSGLVESITGSECINLDLTSQSDTLPNLAARLLVRGVSLNEGWIRRAMLPSSTLAPEYHGIVIDGKGVDTRGCVIDGVTRQSHPQVNHVAPLEDSTAPSHQTALHDAEAQPAQKHAKQRSSITSEAAAPRTDALIGHPIALDLKFANERIQHEMNTRTAHDSAALALDDTQPQQPEGTEDMKTIADVVFEYLDASTKIADRQAQVVHALISGGVAPQDDVTPTQKESRTLPEIDSSWVFESSQLVPEPAVATTGRSQVNPVTEPTSDKTPGTSPILSAETDWNTPDEPPSSSQEDMIDTKSTPSDEKESTQDDTTDTDIHSVVLNVIGERTGYPASMIEDELDLESDLGIDSIKRLEIAGDLIRECGLDTDTIDEVDLEGLSKSRTVASMTEWLEARSTKTETPPSDEIGASDTTTESGVVEAQPFRFELRPTSAATVPHQNDGRTVYLIRSDDSDESGALAEALGAKSFELSDVNFSHGCVVIDFADNRDRERELPDYFDKLKQLAEVPEPSCLLVVRRVKADNVDLTPERSADGMRGLMRTLALELTDTLVGYVEIDLPDEDDATCVRRALECDCTVTPVHVVTENEASLFHLAPAPLDSLATTGAGSSDGRAEALSAAGLNPGATLVFFGGGRGITSVVAQRMGLTCPGFIYVCGSSPIPRDKEPEGLHLSTSLIDLRQALLREGMSDLSQIEVEARRVLAEREIRQTLEGLKESGSTAEYRTVDVRNADQVASFLESVARERGRIDGVVFGSGINRDQLLSRTSRAQFDHVYRTKQDGIDNVLSGLDSCGVLPEFVVAFGSIAAVRGSRGQIGYAAGNDGMQTTLTRWGRLRGVRALTVNWGPWAPQGIHSGMVSTELQRTFLANGRSLIHPTSGADALIQELAWGSRSINSVTYLPEGWS